MGPSGVGKTTLGDAIAEHSDYAHLVIDRGVPGHSGIDEYGLSSTWEDFYYRQRIAPLAQELNRRAEHHKLPGFVLTFSSSVCIEPKSIAAAQKHNVFIRYLYAPREKCIESFIRRERKVGHFERTREFWARNNAAYETMGRKNLREYHLNACDDSGERLSTKQLMKNLFELS